jgi:hypothetical protein
MSVSTDGTAVARRCSNTAFATGTWYFVASVYDASAQTLHVYVNGVLDDGALTGTVPASLFNTPAGGRLGAKSGSTSFFNGLIDDARVYNRALSATDIAALYSAGAVTTCSSPAGSAGDFMYNNVFNEMQYCNGTNWIGIGK